MKKTLLCALMLWGCSSGGTSIPDDTEQPEDQGKAEPTARQRRELKGGSRLKAKWIKGEDGSEIAAGFFDTKLNTDCAFDEGEDGKPRCLPTPSAAHYWPNFPGFTIPIYLYLDSTCTQRAAASSLCAPPLKFARFSDTCGSRTRVAPLTETTTTQVYYKSVSGTCAGSINAAQSQIRVYAFGQALAVSEFALGEITLE